ncbi:XRE family transcriptional regulator [Agrobacterium tumefaciens]|nr:XRE family transcriptional regulator [Agrobacterium tumefaciens]
MCLAKFFRTTPEYWPNLQNAFDFKAAAARLETDLVNIKELEAA